MQLESNTIAISSFQLNFNSYEVYEYFASRSEACFSLPTARRADDNCWTEGSR